MSRGDIPYERWKVSGCWTPAFSPDGKRVYYLADFMDTTRALVSVDLETGKVAALTDAGSFYIIPTGKYAGHIVAMKRKSTLVKVWYWYWLLDAEGNEVAPIGDDRDLYVFRDLYEHEVPH